MTDDFCYLILAAKEREKALKQQLQQKAGIVSTAGSRAASPAPNIPIKKLKPAKSGTSTPFRGSTVDQRMLDLSALNLTSKEEAPIVEEIPKMNLEKEKVLEEARKALEASAAKKGVSLVIIGM